jgi:hypothetical protein
MEPADNQIPSTADVGIYSPPASILDSANNSTGFLVLAWKEMFDPFTPDTFQPRIFGIPQLLRELSDVAARAIREPNRWMPHVRDIQDELAQGITSESQFLQRMPLYKWLARLACKSESPNDLCKSCNVLETFALTYEQEAKDDLRRAITRLPQHKEDAYRALYRLATIVLHSSIEAEAMHSLASDERYKETPIQWVEALIKSIEEKDSPPKTFDCIVPAFGLPEELFLRILRNHPDFHLLRPTKIPFHRDSTLKEAAHFLVSSVRASTPVSAAHFAVKQIRALLDILSFYSRTLNLTIHDYVWVQTEGNGRFVPYAPISLRRQPERRHVLSLTQNALRIPTKNLTGRLQNALEHFSLAGSSMVGRSRLVNLWACLECISMRSEPNQSVIARVQQTVVPIVVWRRVDKITRYLAASMSNARKAGLVTDFGPHIPANGTITAEEVLVAMGKPDKDAGITSLYANIQRHPLLLNRFYVTRQRFMRPESLFQDQSASATRTNWHLQRIYRARNLLVHDGFEVPVVAQLVDNLFYYVSVVISRLLHSMSSHHQLEVDDCLVLWRNRNEYVMDQLKNAPQQLRVRDFFPRPVRCVHDQVWQDQSLASAPERSSEIP